MWDAEPASAGITILGAAEARSIALIATDGCGLISASANEEPRR
jgi:hypothetical protein